MKIAEEQTNEPTHNLNSVLILHISCKERKKKHN
jgi:hypothetical protein